MAFGHDTEHALGVVVDLVNDGVGDLAGLRRFVERHRISGARRLSGTDLTAVEELRPRLRAAFTAPDVESAVRVVNGLVAQSGAVPQLTDHDGLHWHLHYFPPTASLTDRLAADGAMALAFVIASGERDRLRICEAPECERVLVDLSRNRSRRYCDSRACGNRVHVAAYRARRRAH